MTAALAIEVGELVMPGMTRNDGAVAAEAMRDELDLLFRLDAEAGISWRSATGPITVDLDKEETPERIGRSIARHVRKRALEPEQAR